MPRRTPYVHAYPHRAYALRHLNKAVDRLILATTPGQKAQAGRRARLWARAAGAPFDGRSERAPRRKKLAQPRSPIDG